MKLLFDENFSFRLVRSLQDVFPEARHVKFFGLEHESDEVVWYLAQKEGFCIVSKDSDFYERSLAFGHPPKVIWLRASNAPSTRIGGFLREQLPCIQSFLEDKDAALLVMSLGRIEPLS